MANRESDITSNVNNVTVEQLNQCDLDRRNAEKLRDELLRVCDRTLLPAAQIAGVFGMLARVLIEEGVPQDTPSIELAYAETRACFVEGLLEPGLKIHRFKH